MGLQLQWQNTSFFLLSLDGIFHLLNIEHINKLNKKKSKIFLFLFRNWIEQFRGDILNREFENGDDVGLNVSSEFVLMSIF